MDLDNEILRASLRSKAGLLKIISMGVSHEMLSRDAARGLDFIRKHVDQYRDVPSTGVLLESTGVRIIDAEETPNLEFVVDKLFERREFEIMRTAYLEIGDRIENGELKQAKDRWTKTADRLVSLKSKKSGVKTLADLAPAVMKRYEDAKDGVMGVKFMWPKVNLWTRGMMPKTLTFFLARPGVGKTFVLTVTLMGAWLDGYKILIVSPEMDAESLAERVVCAHATISYPGIVSGVLSEMSEKALKNEIAALQTPEYMAERFLILDDEDNLTPDTIMGVVENERPDIVGVDSSYMLRVTNFGRDNEKFAETVGWMRRSARRTGIPWVGVSQLSREATKLDSKQMERMKTGESTAGVENMAAKSDELLWSVDNLIGLNRDDDMEKARQMLVSGLKVRRRGVGGGILSFLCNWDLESMNFDEIGAVVDEYHDVGAGDLLT